MIYAYRVLWKLNYPDPGAGPDALTDMTEEQLSAIRKNTTINKGFVTKYAEGISHALQNKAAFYLYMIKVIRM